MFLLFSVQQQNGLSVNVLTSLSNKGVVLALVAMAQTLVILTGGFDLSAGMILTMASCLASVLVNGSPGQVALGVVAVLLCGLAAGAINATVVVLGRIQPIIATLATGAIYFGIALLLRPSPGGEVSEDLSNALTYDLGGIPTTFLLLVGILVFVWWPFRNSVVGRNCYAVGSAEGAAYMSGLAIGRSRFAAYSLGGLLAAAGGLALSLISLSGEASASQGGFYTLNSIAAVAIGGTSLFGGSGGMIGSILGAFIFGQLAICCLSLTLRRSGNLFFKGSSCSARFVWAACAFFVTRTRWTSFYEANSLQDKSADLHRQRLYLGDFGYWRGD